MERIEALSKGGKIITGVPSGFADLDDITSGFQPSELIIVAARPQWGRRRSAQPGAARGHRAQHADRVLLARDEQGIARPAPAHERGPHRCAADFAKGLLRDDDFPRLARAAGILSSAPIYIDDSAGISLFEMRSRARRLKVDSGVGMVIVDYLQLIQGPRAENRQQEISQISRSLKALAKELAVPVIALSQLSRAPEQRTGESKRPQLSDLRESGAIEQDADLVVFLFRPEVYEGPTDKDGNSLEGRSEIIVGKQRNGPIGTVNLYFHKTTRGSRVTRRGRRGDGTA